MTWKSTIALVLGGLGAAGCHIGPKWEGKFDVPRPAESVQGKTLIVSGFLQTVSQASVTGSAQIQTLNAAGNVIDISAEVASALASEGLRAEARSEFGRTSLAPDQLLLKGAVISARRDEGKGPFIGLVILTGALVGGILPSPVPVSVGSDIHYSIEVVAPDGRFLVKTGQKRVWGYYREHWAWVVDSKGKRVAQEFLDLAKPLLLKEVARALK